MLRLKWWRRIKDSSDGTKYVYVDKEIVSDFKTAKEIAKTLSDIVKNKFDDFINVSGQKIGINGRTVREWQHSKDAQYLLANEKQKYNDKINAFNNADELLKVARDYVGEEIKHYRKDNFVEFARGIVDFKVGNRGYSADVVVGTTKSNVALLYDVVNLQEKEIEDASHTAQDRRAETSSNDIIDKIPPTVKNNISPETDNYSEDGPFSVGSPMQQARENLKKYENGELTREQYLEENEQLWGEAIEKYGSIPEGENADAPIATPKAVDEGKLTERFVRTIIETGRLTDETLENIEEKVLVGDFSYKAVSDDVAIKNADTAIKKYASI